MYNQDSKKFNSDSKNIYKIKDILAHQSQHLINKELFNLRFYKMHPIQVRVENILLVYEEDVYFNRQNKVEEDVIYNNLLKNDKEKLIKKNLKSKNYKCEVKNCNKTYTSAYGLRYHTSRGHRVDADESKPFCCTFYGCKKRYKNSNGLKYHSSHSHN